MRAILIWAKFSNETEMPAAKFSDCNASQKFHEFHENFGDG
jgi:hypothetical protein